MTPVSEFFDVYFLVKPEHYESHKIVLQHDSGDILAITDNINAYVLYEDSVKTIVKTRLQKENFEAFIENIPEGVNPFSYEGAACLGLSKAYIGHTFEEVLERFPELAGTKTEISIDPDGNEITTEIAYVTDTIIS